jgi:hypothetical protein
VNYQTGIAGEPIRQKLIYTHQLTARGFLDAILDFIDLRGGLFTCYI